MKMDAAIEQQALKDDLKRAQEDFNSMQRNSLQKQSELQGEVNQLKMSNEVREKDIERLNQTLSSEKSQKDLKVQEMQQQLEGTMNELDASRRICALFIDQVEVQDVKWLWESSDGGSRWLHCDVSLCRRLERHFQLWLFAKTTTCWVCEARRATFPFDPATIGSSFVHAHRPDVMWRFHFACDKRGKPVIVQVLLAM